MKAIFGRRLTATLMTTIGFALIATTGTAGASIHVKTRQAHSDFGGAFSAAATAKCKSGYTAVGGGGIVTDNPVPSAGDIRTAFNIPGDSKREWATQEAYLEGSGTLTTKARCLKGVKKIKIRKASADIAAADMFATSVAKTAHCPNGYKVLGGGGIITGNPTPDPLNVWLGFSMPDGQGWNVQGVSGMHYPVRLTTFATCAKNVKAKTVHASASVPQNSASVATAKCPKGWKVTGGGGILTGDPIPNAAAVQLSFMIPGDDGRSWLTQGYAAAPNVTLTTKARCLKA